MKTSIATTLSIAGVLAAGAAAYAVNTSVLGASADPTPAAVVSTTTTNAASSAQSGDGNVSDASATEVVNVVNGSTTTYTVGNAGSVVIDTSTGQIVVTSILPAAGFTSEPARTDANGAVKVHFVSATQRIEFIARMVNGAVVTDVVNESAPVVSQPPRRDDDDEHDEDHVEREHDDEDHHDEDDD